MPESRSEQIRHSNEEVANFLICGDARGPAWLARHPEHRARAMSRLTSRAHGVAISDTASMEQDPSAFPATSRDGGRHPR